MTLIPGTNREDGPCVVWIGTTIHGLDDVYGPFPNCVAAGDFIDQKVAEEWCSKENALILMLPGEKFRTNDDKEQDSA